MASVFYRYKLHHLLFWLVFAAIWYYLRYQDYSTTQKAVQVTVIKVLDLALLIYVCNYLLIPGLLYKKRYALFVKCIARLRVLLIDEEIHCIKRVEQKMRVDLRF